ncbi:MAG: DUF6266 family protein [Candidatus Bathyarchaeia archaeon]
MAKVKMPIVGTSASGQLGKSIVYGSWRGVSYARQLVHPSNPRTENQMKTRSVFSYLNEFYKIAPSALAEVWDEYAKGKPFLGRNAFLSFNISALRESIDNIDQVNSPGVRGGFALASLQATQTGNAGELMISVSWPVSIPGGWTIQRAYAIVFRVQDPHEAVVEQIRLGQIHYPDNSVVVSGLSSGEMYVVSAWAVYLRSDGKVAYGPSLNVLGQPL